MAKKVLYVAIDKLTKEVYKFKQWSECQKLVSEGKYVYKGFSQEELKDVESYIASFKQTMDESQLNLNEKDENSIRAFVIVMSLIAQASAIKKLVQKMVNEYHSE